MEKGWEVFKSFFFWDVFIRFQLEHYSTGHVLCIILSNYTYLSYQLCSSVVLNIECLTSLTEITKV